MVVMRTILGFLGVKSLFCQEVVPHLTSPDCYSSNHDVKREFQIHCVATKQRTTTSSEP